MWHKSTHEYAWNSFIEAFIKNTLSWEELKTIVHKVQSMYMADKESSVKSVLTVQILKGAENLHVPCTEY